MLKRSINNMVYSVLLVAAIFGFKIAFSTDAHAQSFPEGMVSYWKFDEGNGTIASDSVGTNGGSIYGGTWIESIVGSALFFDGVNDYVTVANETNFDFERTSSLTIEAWIQTPSGNHGTVILSKQHATPDYRGYGFDVIGTPSVIRFSLLSDWAAGNYIQIKGSTVLSDGQWHHVVATYNGNSSASGVKLYVDGNLETKTVINDSLSSTILNDKPLRLGTWEYLSYYWHGIIDEVAIYNRVLTAEEAQEHYQKGQQGLGYADNLNGQPIADAGPDQSVEQANPSGAQVTLDGTGSSDSDGDTLTYTWTGPFGEATGATPTVTMPPGANTVYLVVNDGTVDSETDTVTITVQDTTVPVVSNTTANPNPVAVNTACAIIAQIDDTASNISYAEYSTDGGTRWYSMDAITAGTNSVNVSVTMSGFTEPGLLTVSVRGTDSENNTGEPESIYLPVYDPSAGHVTGGGWIWSPQGAYAANTTLEGKAHFGFVAKYKKGANTPDGNTEFQFKTANLNFHSNTYEWLVVAGYKAMFKGTGTINGEGSYKFMISAVDGSLKNNSAEDTFRIRIWGEDSAGEETTIYDNQMDADIDAEPTTTLGGGSIIIHKGK